MHVLDFSIILIYLVGVTWFGARFRKGQHNLQEYFLGGKSAPWWAISLSIVSAETSTLTIIGTPPLAFNGNFAFLQVVFGYLLARLVISSVLLPQYFRGQIFTAYQIMQARFGTRIRKLTAAIFLITRSLAEGVRVFAIATVISIILGTGELASILLIVCLTLFYTFEGGMTAVIWTDVLQMGMYVAGAALSFFVILGKLHGGWSHAVAVASAAHKFQVFDFGPYPSFAAFWAKPYSFWAGVIGGCFLTTASHGTDQLIVQRLLSARSLRESRAALLASWAVVFVQFTLFLVIGTLLWVYFQEAHLPSPKPMDSLYPRFVWDNLPPGLAGLVIAAILAAAMANLSAALNSLASTTVVDFLHPFTPGKTDAGTLKQARMATAAWAVVLVAIGLVASQWGSVLQSGLSIASITLGILLGVFLLGTWTRRVGEQAAMWGVLIGLAVIFYVKFATGIAFTWWVLIGSVATFAGGYGTSFLVRESKH